MARSLRIQYSGAFYHVMARGNRREKIFLDDDDRRFFLKALGEACEMTGWRVHAWVLMGNHYHLFIETPEPNLVHGMSWLQNTVTRRHNSRHGLWGRLFGDRYKAVPVDGADFARYHTLCDYIHLNPVRARMIRPDRKQSILDYSWSSLAGGYRHPPTKRPKWLVADEGLRRMELPDTAAGRRRLVERLDRRAVEEEFKRCGIPPIEADVDARCSNLQRGWYWGGQAFFEKLQKLIGKAAGGKGRNKRGARSTAETRSHGEAQAEAWLKEGLKAAGLATKDLAGLPGSDPRKLAIAELIWKRTSVSQVWIAERLGMRSAANVSQQLRRLDRVALEKRLSKPMRSFLADALSR